MITESGKDLIESGNWAMCWICETVFRRKRETKRYCSKCLRGWCEGEHGNFAYNTGKCIVCGVKKEDKV